ncbi:MAG: thiamine-phosphate pyrophosphorylase [Deltaproteobacteria bacterium]
MKRRTRPNRPGAISESAALRIIDANLNRAKEGLRTCEDIARFAIRSAPVLRQIAALRHAVGRAFAGGRLGNERLLSARDVAGDPGKEYRLGPGRRKLRDVFFANAQRVKEALRVLEEVTKLFDAGASRRLQQTRFKFYEWEKTAGRRLIALSDPR